MSEKYSYTGHIAECMYGDGNMTGYVCPRCGQNVCSEHLVSHDRSHRMMKQLFRV